MALLLIICLAGGGLLIGTRTDEGQPEQRIESALPSKKVVASEERKKTIEGSVQRGDTISSLLGGLLSPQDIHELTRQSREVYPLTRISGGQPYKLSLQGGNFKRFAYDINCNDQLVICRDEDGFSVSREPISYLLEQAAVRGTIESSLFQAVVDIGESEAMAIKLADIFAWDIDFFHDIRTGDSFRVVVEKRYRQGQPSGNGRLLAASFTVQDQTYQAFYFQDGNRPPGYYDQNGNSLRKAFLKAPLSFSRISSGFDLHRRHPITHRTKAHRPVHPFTVSATAPLPSPPLNATTANASRFATPTAG